MFNQKVVRIIAVVLAALMFLGVIGVAINAFALGSSPVVTVSVPTGEKHSPIPIIVGCIALIAVIVCLIISGKNKKKAKSRPSKEYYIDENKIDNNIMTFSSKKSDVYVEKPSEDTSNDEPTDETTVSSDSNPEE